jgi:hypothetical protein
MPPKTEPPEKRANTYRAWLAQARVGNRTRLDMTQVDVCIRKVLEDMREHADLADFVLALEVIAGDRPETDLGVPPLFPNAQRELADQETG